MRRVWLGADCGTQSTKAVLLDAETLAVVGLGRAAHALIEGADGTREQPPEWWTAALVEAVRAALAEAGPVVVAGVGVSGQQHGLVALDAADRPVRPAKLWNDTTTAAECASLTEALGGPAAALAATGNAFLPGYTAPKLLWLRRREPGEYARSRRFCLPHDYLNLWLTGAFATEPGDASGTAYFDVRTRRYATGVLAAVDDARDWASALPPVVPSLSQLGTLRGAAARELGLPAGVPVSAGGGDNMCAAIGAGAVAPGPTVMSLGTSGTAFARTDAPALDPLGEAAAFCDSAGGWLPLVCTLNCTGATEWVRHLFGLDRAAFEAALRTAPAGANGLTFLPYLDGERTPNRPHGAGTLAGLRPHHTPADTVRAVVEGVTFGLVYGLGALRRSGVDARSIRLVGGGAASDAWAQLCADATGLPVHRLPEFEAAARGAALQARAAVDGAPLPTDAPAGDDFLPNPPPALAEAAARAARLRDAEV